MEISLKIRRIEAPENTYDTLTLNYDGVETEFRDSIAFEFPKFHDTILGETKILLMKNSFPWALCNGVVILNNSFLRSAEEKYEHSAEIVHKKYYTKANSYDFREREGVGKLYYEFTRTIYREDKVRTRSSNKFVQRMFELFLNDEKTGAMLNIKKLMDYVNSGSNTCRLNILVGGVLIGRYVAELNNRSTKNIELTVEIDDSDVPRIFKCGDRFPGPSAPGSEGPRRLRLKTSTGVPEGNSTAQMSRILSSDGYVICDLGILLRIKHFFYLTMGAYGNSWPKMFITPQRQVDGGIPDNRKAVVEILGIEDRDLLHVHLEASDAVQHIVFYDRAEERIVVSFKGTTNSNETIQDVNCDYAEFSDGFVHNGFRKLAALFVENRIPHIRRLMDNMKTNRLLLAGHSLGGAIAMLVNIMLKEMSLMGSMDVETVAISSPPVVSANIARRFRDGITVLNYGNDIITRMSYGSILDLKFLCCSIGEKRGPLGFSEEIGDEIETVISYLRRTNIHPKLYFPGELVHVKRVRCSLNKNSSPIVVFSVVDTEFFEQIVLVKHGLKHHSVGHLEAVIREGIALFEQRTQ